MSRDVCGICWCPYDEDGGCGCKPTQPEALRLAEALDELDAQFSHPGLCGDAAAELRRLHAENEALQKALRRVIRIYRVDDQTWNPEAEVERIYQMEMKK